MNNIENHNFILESVIVKEDNGYFSLCLDVDVASQGDSVEEAKMMLKEAVELYIESSIDNTLPILRRTPDDSNPLFIDKENVVDHFNLKLKLEISLDA